MRVVIALLLLGSSAALLAPPAAMAQTSQAPLDVGTMAPDFEIPGATRYGILQDPVRLSEYRGKTVVLAFFFRARSRG